MILLLLLLDTMLTSPFQNLLQVFNKGVLKFTGNPFNVLLG